MKCFLLVILVCCLVISGYMHACFFVIFTCFFFSECLTTVQPRYNAVVRVHRSPPRYKRGRVIKGHRNNGGCKHNGWDESLVTSCIGVF